MFCLGLASAFAFLYVAVWQQRSLLVSIGGSQKGGRGFRGRGVYFRSNMRSFRALTCSFGPIFKNSEALRVFSRDFSLAKGRPSSISRLPGSILRPKNVDFRGFS